MTPTTELGLPRQKIIVSAITASILVVTMGVFFFEHIVSPPRNPNVLSHERKLGLSDADNAVDCTAAIPLLTQVVAAASTDSVATEALGQCYEALGENDNALPLLDNVASFEPSLSDELALARAAFFSGHIALVKSAMMEAAVKAVTPNDILSVVQTAQSYGVYPVAQDALGRTRFALRTYAWYSEEAATQLDLGNPSVAVAAAVRAVHLAPASSRGGLDAGLGDTYVGAGEYAAAADAYEEALATHQPIDTTSVYTELAQCYINLSRFSKALATAQLGLKNPTDAGAFNLQISEATALAGSQRTSKAIQVLTSIVTRSSAPADVVATASAMLSALGH